MKATTLSASSRHQRSYALVGMLSAILCALTLAGCQNSAASLSEEVDGDSAQAMVTSIDGSTLTVNIMAGDPGQNAGGNPPDAPSGDAQGDQNGSGSTDASDSSSAASDGSSAGDSKQEPPAKPEGESGSADASGSAASSDSASDSSSSSSASTSESGDSSSSSESSTDSSTTSSGSTDSQASGDQNGQGGEPPAKPEGDSNGQDGEQPDMSSGAAPDGNAPDGNAPGGTEMTLTINDESIIYTTADGNETQGSLSDITEGSMLQLSIENGKTVTKIVIGNGGPGGAGGQGSDTVNNGTGATTISSDTTTESESYDSTNVDENALRVESGANAAVSKATITKTGDSSSSNDSDFYGLNAAVLAYDGSSLDLSDATISSDSSGSNGVFAYGEGTSVTVSDSTIKNTAGNSGGIEVAGGATLTASNLDVDTQGESSAAIRSDRGGGTETVTGGSYATHGKYSPAVYSTANVSVSDATLTSENTEGIVIEGKNSATLENCDVTSNSNGAETKSGVVNNVMIYQSTSGDASEGTGSFTMKGGSFKAEHGYLFYVTNTDATIDLDDVDIDNAEGQLLMIAGNDGIWGTQGSNGGSVTFTATDQTLSGSITVDSASSLTLKLSNSSYTGAINSDGAAGTVDVELSDGATWTLDGDCYVSSLSGDTAGIDLNGHTLYVNGEAWSA